MNNDYLKPTERLDYLECKDLSLIQDKNGYTFTMDAVLLANFARALPGDKVIDLGTGSGVVPILMSAKTTAKTLYGVELQARLADMAERSVKLNGLSERVKIICTDMKKAVELFGAESFDVCTSNPPYKVLSGDAEGASEKDICKSEVAITLGELVVVATKLLKFGGLFFVIIKADRVTDLLYEMRKNGLEPKRLVAVQPTPTKAVDTVMVEGKKGAKRGLRFESTLVIYNADGTVTKEAKEKYHQ